MRKIIDIDTEMISKLKLIAAIQDSSVKKVMENAVKWYIEYMQQQQINSMTMSQKEDMGLLLLLQQANTNATVNEDELFQSE